MALVHRHSVDLHQGDAHQCGCRIIVDGEARSEAWEEVGPFDTIDQAMRTACEVATNLYRGQLAGQQSIF